MSGLGRVGERALAVAARLPRPEVLLGWLIVAHVVLKVLLFPMEMNSPGFGDEQAYLNGGMALSNAIRDLFDFTAPDRTELDRNVVASGWFMPGMSILVAPIYVVFPDAGPGLVRAWLGLITLAIWIAVLRHVARTLGARWAVVLAVFPGLVPMWVMFSFATFGDLAAGMVLMLVVLRLAEMFRGFRHASPPSLRDGVVLGLLSIAALYLRSSTAVLLAGLGVVTLLAAVVMLRGRIRLRAVGSAAAAGAVFLTLVAPWSAYASDVLGARVLTTTTVPTVRAVTFGERDQICFGECDPASTVWFRPLRYAREVGAATDTSEVEVLKVMSSYALRDLDPIDYLAQVDYNLAAYALVPTTFVHHLAPEGGRGPVGTTAGWAVQGVTWLMYFPVLLLAAASLLTVARRSLEARLLDVLVKLSLGALLVQPFVHIGGGRYWTTAAAFYAIAAVSFLRERQLAGAGAGAGPGGPAPATSQRDAVVVRWLNRVQVLLARAVALVVVVLAVGGVAALVRLLLQLW